jgi:hypothetical protein
VVIVQGLLPHRVHRCHHPLGFAVSLLFLAM